MREEMVIILTEAEDQSCAINGRIKIGSYRNANAYCGKTDGGILLTLIRQNRLQIILGSKIRSNNFIGEGLRLDGNIALRHIETDTRPLMEMRMDCQWLLEPRLLWLVTVTLGSWQRHPHKIPNKMQT